MTNRYDSSPNASSHTTFKGNVPQPVKVLPLISSSVLTNQNHPPSSHLTNIQDMYNHTKPYPRTHPKKYSVGQKLKISNFVLPVGIQLPPALPAAILSTSPRIMNTSLMFKLGHMKNNAYKSDSSSTFKLRYNHGLTNDEIQQINEQVQKITSIISSGTSIK